MLGWIIVGIIAIPFIVLAIFLFNGKGSFLIAGFNTMSADEKATYDKTALCKAVGRLLLILTALMLLWPLSFEFGSAWLFWLSFILFMGVTIGFAIYANTGNRFKVPVDPDSPATAKERKPMTRGKKAALAIAIILSVQVCVGVVIIIYQGESDPRVRISGNTIHISSLFGTDISFTDIAEISLIPDSMSRIGIGRRTNGYATSGQALKGTFQSAEYGHQLLFVYSSSSPTIHIKLTGGVDVFISYRDSESTRSIYHALSSAFLNR
jgi:hypothetical protein